MAFTPMLLVKDVEASSTWLCQVLPLTSAHGGPDFEMLANSQGEVIVWLHAAETDHQHPQFEGINLEQVTGGTILYLQVADAGDVDKVCEKAALGGARTIEEPHFNPLARFVEGTFEDPNGYRFAVHTPFGSANP